jgi:PhoH-like ATPase
VSDSTPRRTVVLDTSVLVSDPGALHCFDGEALVVPLIVIEELDGHKTRRDDVGAAARAALRSIETLRSEHAGDIRSPIELPNGGSVRVETNGVHLQLIRDLGLDESKPDNRILAACCGLRFEGADVRVITNDTAMRIKAAQLGFEAAEHVRHRSNRHDDETGGWPTIEVSTGLIESLFAGSHPLLFDDLDLEDREVADLTANSFAVLRSGTSSVLVRSHGKALSVLPSTQHAYGLSPRSKEQRGALELLLDPTVSVVALDGIAGTGKTVLALAAGLQQVVERPHRYERVAVYRPIVPVGKADMGFLPGTLDEKLEPWMSAIHDAIVALTDSHSYLAARDIIDELTSRGKLTMESVTFLRGRTLQSSFIVVDEAQNLEPTTVKTILTRVGEGTKIVFCGDRDQIDAPYLSKHNNGLAILLEAFRGQPCFGGVLLTSCERSAVAALAATLL